MSRKVIGVAACWLAAVSAATAQAPPPAVKGKLLSPYYATASTLDWEADDESPVRPDLLPPPPAAKPAPPATPPVVQASAPASQGSSIRQAGAVVPAEPAPPAAPAGPKESLTPPSASTENKSAPVPAAPAGSTGSPNCNCNCNPCGPNGPCGPAGRFWADAELLLWWPRGMNLPTLVTSSPSGTPRSLAGVLGAPNTRVLFGNDTVDDDLRAGLRVRGGLWLDDCQTLGIEGSFFFLGPNSENHNFNCMDSGILARPFIDVNPNAPNPLNTSGGASANSELVCFPGIVNGNVNIHTSTDLYGFDANVIQNLCCGCNYRVDGLLGYRYLNLKDRVYISESLTALATNNPSLPAGTTFVLDDRFSSTNDFNGGQLGVCGEYRVGRWYLGGRNLVALGNTHSEITIAGATRVTTPNGFSTVNAGGLLTQATNIGAYNDDRFAVVYEGESILGYQVTDGIRAFVAYSFLYWSNVSRAGDQIDAVVNSSQIPPGALNGAPRPIFQRRDTDFWAQGVSFGVEVRY